MPFVTALVTFFIAWFLINLVAPLQWAAMAAVVIAAGAYLIHLDYVKNRRL